LVVTASILLLFYLFTLADKQRVKLKASKVWLLLNKAGELVYVAFCKVSNLVRKMLPKPKKIHIDKTAQSNAVKATPLDVVKAAFNKACIRVNLANIVKG
jgi:hypothetical protein